MNIKLIVAATAIVALSGCATIIKGDDQDLNVATASGSASNCTVTGGSMGEVNQTFTTPAVVTVPRSAKTLNFRCANGATKDLDGKIEPWTVGNILFGGFIGLGVDAYTGAIHKYESDVVIGAAMSAM